MSKKKSPPMTWEQSVRWLLDNSDERMRQLASHCFFDGTALESATRFADSEEWIAVRGLLPKPPGKALDLGAGRGISSFALARDGWTVTAVEPDRSKLVGSGAIRELSSESGFKIKIVKAKAEKLPFDDEAFDVVHCRQALHHADDLEQMCRESLRVLRKGGVFIATREHVLSREEDIHGFLARHPLHYLYGGEWAYTLSRYTSALEANKPASIEAFSPLSTIINLFPSDRNVERGRMAQIAGVQPADIPDYMFKILDEYDQTPGRFYSFKVIK